MSFSLLLELINKRYSIFFNPNSNEIHNKMIFLKLIIQDKKKVYKNQVQYPGNKILNNLDFSLLCNFLTFIMTIYYFSQ